MARARKAPKVRIVCGTCGSEDVSRDAWGDWDFNTQTWVVRTVFDYAHCHECDGETRLAEIPLRKVRKRAVAAR
jgi:hypothetical protein